MEGPRCGRAGDKLGILKWTIDGSLLSIHEHCSVGDNLKYIPLFYEHKSETEIHHRWPLETDLRRKIEGGSRPHVSAVGESSLNATVNFLLWHDLPISTRDRNKARFWVESACLQRSVRCCSVVGEWLGRLTRHIEGHNGGLSFEYQVPYLGRYSLVDILCGQWGVEMREMRHFTSVAKRKIGRILHTRNTDMFVEYVNTWCPPSIPDLARTCDRPDLHTQNTCEKPMIFSRLDLSNFLAHSTMFAENAVSVVKALT